MAAADARRSRVGLVLRQGGQYRHAELQSPSICMVYADIPVSMLLLELYTHICPYFACMEVTN